MFKRNQSSFHSLTSKTWDLFPFFVALFLNNSFSPSESSRVKAIREPWTRNSIDAVKCEKISISFLFSMFLAFGGLFSLSLRCLYVIFLSCLQLFLSMPDESTSFSKSLLSFPPSCCKSSLSSSQSVLRRRAASCRANFLGKTKKFPHSGADFLLNHFLSSSDFLLWALMLFAFFLSRKEPPAFDSRTGFYFASIRIRIRIRRSKCLLCFWANKNNTTYSFACKLSPCCQM